MLVQALMVVLCGLSAVSAQRVLALPDPKSCAKRKQSFDILDTDLGAIK